MKRILQYLKGTQHIRLHYLLQSPLYACSDTDRVGCSITRSTSGFCVFFVANYISWCSKKQPIVARSSSKAIYRSMASTTIEITWLTFFRDIGTTLPRLQLFYDNMSTLHMSINPMFHALSIHIDFVY